MCLAACLLPDAQRSGLERVSGCLRSRSGLCRGPSSYFLAFVMAAANVTYESVSMGMDCRCAMLMFFSVDPSPLPLVRVSTLLSFWCGSSPAFTVVWYDYLVDLPVEGLFQAIVVTFECTGSISIFTRSTLALFFLLTARRTSRRWPG